MSEELIKLLSDTAGYLRDTRNHAWPYVESGQQFQDMLNIADRIDSTLSALTAPQSQQEPVAFPLIAAHFIQRTGAKLCSERMNPHDERARLSWIETKAGIGICDITNDEYFAIREFRKMVLPPLYTAPSSGVRDGGNND